MMSMERFATEEHLAKKILLDISVPIVTRYYGELITYYYSIDFSLHNKTEQKIAPNGLTDKTNQNADTYGDLDRYYQQICGCNTINKCIAVYRRCIIRNHMYHS
ncbi:unnamed protein product, partial [Didymodactylos carnosus]